jgi:hypothetical protein
VTWRARHVTGLELVARAAGDPELRVALELGQQAGEELRVERHVGVELHDDVDRLADRVQPRHERARHRAPTRRHGLAGYAADDDRGVAAGEPGGDAVGAVRRAVVDDHPQGGRRRLLEQAARDPLEIGGLVPGGGDDGVAHLP